MMISPKSFEESFKEESLDVCQKEKVKLEQSIKDYENKHTPTKKMLSFNPEDMVYRCEKMYLDKLEKLIKKKEKEIKK